MAGTTTPIFPQTIKNTAVQIASTTGTGTIVAYTGGANGSKIESWIVTLTDTVTANLVINYTVSATAYQLGIVNIPLSSGNINSVPSVNILNQAQIPGLAHDANGNPYLYIASGTTLTISVQATLTTGKVLNSIIQAGDY